MNKRIYILLITSILTVPSVFGQLVGKDNLSISLFYMQKSELDSAKKYIDLSITDDKLKLEPKTWYYRGFIYKELYKNKEKHNKLSPLRDTSVESFKKLLTLEGKDEFSESSFKILNFLASTLYNDAVRTLDIENYNTAIINYEAYKSTMLIINPVIDLKPEDIKFKLALASMLNRPKENQMGLDSALSYKVENLYLEILSIDPNNPVAHYNLARLYYNDGADIVNALSYDMDLTVVNKEEDRFIELFLKALPYMKKSYELNYKPKETLMGLSSIYLGLSDMEKSDAYKKELEDLEKE